MDRERYASGTDWDSTAGYSGAIRAGNEIHVSGTTATDDDGAVVGVGDPYAQTMRTLDDDAEALSALSASLDDVVRGCSSRTPTAGRESDALTARRSSTCGRRRRWSR